VCELVGSWAGGLQVGRGGGGAEAGLGASGSRSERVSGRAGPARAPRYRVTAPFGSSAAKGRSVDRSRGAPSRIKNRVPELVCSRLLLLSKLVGVCGFEVRPSNLPNSD